MAASLSLFSEANSYPCYPLEGSGKVLFHCAECRKTFVSFAGVRTHSCNGTESNTPGEKTTTTTQGHICQDFVIGACHLTDEHRVQLEFPTMAEAMNCLEEHELDKDLRIRTSSAKRKVFQCRCALKRQTQTRKILKPLQESQVPSTKVNDCQAKLLFIRVVRCQCPQPESRQHCLVSSEVVQVMGCLSHSHPIEKRDMRLSQAAKGYAADLLKSGLEPKVILDQYFPMAEGDDCTRPITQSDLYRMGQTPELLDNRGEGTPVFQCLVENENQAIFSVALRVFKDLVPEACPKVKCLLSDTSHTFVNALKEVVGEIQWSVCHWHLEKSWTKNIIESEMLQEVKGLRLIVTEGEFNEKLAKIKDK